MHVAEHPAPGGKKKVGYSSPDHPAAACTTVLHTPGTDMITASDRSAASWVNGVLRRHRPHDLAAMAISACPTSFRPRPAVARSANASARRRSPTAPMRSATACASRSRRVAVHAHTPRAVRRAPCAGRRAPGDGGRREMHRSRSSARRSDREADGRQGRLLELAAVHRRPPLVVPRRIAEPGPSSSRCSAPPTAPMRWHTCCCPMATRSQTSTSSRIWTGISLLS